MLICVHVCAIVREIMYAQGSQTGFLVCWLLCVASCAHRMLMKPETISLGDFGDYANTKCFLEPEPLSPDLCPLTVP